MTKRDIANLAVELDLLKDEYRNLKNEIASNLSSARQVTGITLASIGALMATGKIAMDAGMVDVFLIVPFLFYALAWTQLRYVFLVLDMGEHLRMEIAPNIRRIVRMISSGNDDDYNHILSWENQGRGPGRSIQNRWLRFWFFPIAGATFGIPLLAAIFSVIAFFFLKDEKTGVTVLEIVLILANVVAIVYSFVWALFAERKR